MEYLRGGLQAELKQETGPWTIRISKTSNIIIIWNLYQYRYHGKYPDAYSCTRSSSKSFNFWFSEKLYLISMNGEHKTVHWIWKKGKLPEDQCIAACESMVYAYMYLGLFIYLWIWKNGWNFWKPSMLYNVHMWDILVLNDIQDPKFLGLPSN